MAETPLELELGYPLSGEEGVQAAALAREMLSRILGSSAASAVVALETLDILLSSLICAITQDPSRRLAILNIFHDSVQEYCLHPEAESEPEPGPEE